MMKVSIFAAVIFLSLHIALVVSAEPRFYDIRGAGPGSVGQPFLRADVKGYNPSWLKDDSLPSPRAVSWAMAKGKTTLRYPEKRLSQRFSTSMLTYFGQMVSHDMTHRSPPKAAPQEDNIAIAIPPDDGFFITKAHGTRVWNITRDAAVNQGGKRTAINNGTAFIDLSHLYSTIPGMLDKMRKKDGSGELEMDPNGRDLPLVLSILTPTELAQLDDEFYKKVQQYPNLRATGDVRGNQNPGALSMRTLFFRNHNRLAKKYKKECPDCTDDDLFKRARRWNIAQFQAITFYEYVPQLGLQLPLYTGYNKDLVPGIDNFFSTVAYRYGHSEVVDTYIRLNENGTELEQGHITLSECYYNPDVTIASGVESVIRGMAVQLQGEVEPHFAVSIQQHMMGPAYVNGSDLCATNIFRARDHGLPLYNDARKEFGLGTKATWADVTKDTTLQQLLAQAYAPNGPAACDAYICGLAEDKLPLSHFGELFNASMVSQYLRIRDGDPLYFENTGPQGPGFTQAEVNAFKSTSLKQIILDNTAGLGEYEIKHLPLSIWNTDGQPTVGGGPSNSTEDESSAWTVNGDSPNRLSFRQGQYVLSWKVSEQHIDITVNTSGKGWIGFGIAKDQFSGMLGADMVVASKDSRQGSWNVEDYFSVAKAEVPKPDALRQARNDVQNWQVRKDGDRTIVTFRRPLGAGDPLDLPITLDKPQTIILAWHPDNPVFTTQHFAQTRQMVAIDWVSGREAGLQLQLNAKRRQHGQLMGIAFVLLFPLGALLIRCLRYHFIKSQGIQAVLFYCHTTVQCTATAISTWGLVTALTQLTDKSYRDVDYHHGTLGIAIMALVYTQLLLGLIRPPGRKDGTISFARRAWDVIHSTFGRFVLLLGIANVFIGIHLYDRYANHFGTWVALCAASVVILAWLQQFLDRMEMLYVSQHMAPLSKDSAAPITSGLGSQDLGLPNQETPDARDQALPIHTHSGMISDKVPSSGTRPWSRKFSNVE